MENKTVVVDTSVLNDYYRKTDKTKAVWTAMLGKGHRFAVSAITKFEIYSGATPNQIEFWNRVLSKIEVLPVDENVIDTAVSVSRELKKKRKQIDLADLLIASTALRNALPISTLNKKHFERIADLTLLEIQ